MVIVTMIVQKWGTFLGHHVYRRIIKTNLTNGDYAAAAREVVSHKTIELRASEICRTNEIVRRVTETTALSPFISLTTRRMIYCRSRWVRRAG